MEVQHKEAGNIPVIEVPVGVSFEFDGNIFLRVPTLELAIAESAGDCLRGIYGVCLANGFYLALPKEVASEPKCRVMDMVAEVRYKPVSPISMPSPHALVAEVVKELGE